MNKFETSLDLDAHVIHTRYNGSVCCSDILAAIKHWVELLEHHPLLHVLIFDYSHATMTELNPEDVVCIAEATEELVKRSASLRMVGVMPEDIDQMLTEVWKTYTNIKLQVPKNHMRIVRSKDELDDVMCEIMLELNFEISNQLFSERPYIA